MKIFLLLSFLILCVSISNAASCKDDVFRIKANTYNISELKGMEIKTIKNKHDFRFTVCGNIEGECGSSNCKRVKKYTGCQIESPWYQNCLGLYEEGEEIIKEIEIGGKRGISISHGGGDKYFDGCMAGVQRIMRIEILCDEDAMGYPLNIDFQDSYCEPKRSPLFVFRFEHRVGCPICDCSSNGKCALDEDNNIYCKCEHPYVGKTCHGMRKYNVDSTLNNS